MDKTQIDKIQQFRAQVYWCFPKRAAASINLIDALASTTKVDSTIALSESLVFKRKFPSVYDALDEGQLDKGRLAQVLSGWLVEGAQTIAGYEIYSCDSTANPRPDGPAPKTGRAASEGHLADCLPERVLLKSDSKTPAVPGQEYAGIVRVLREKSSWVAPFDLQRVPSDSTANAIAAQQVKCLHDLSPQKPKVITADSRYAKSGPSRPRGPF